MPQAFGSSFDLTDANVSTHLHLYIQITVAVEKSIQAIENSTESFAGKNRVVLIQRIYPTTDGENIQGWE